MVATNPYVQNLLPFGYILRGHYKIIKLIERGGFGITYLAQDLDLPDCHLCVVKQLNREKYQDASVLDKVIELFQRESKTLYELGLHPQIPTLFACFEEKEELFFVQEYIEGHNLKREINSNILWSETKTVNFLKEILSILDFVHKNSYIHRDLKPSNIMRRQSDGKIFLIDFGCVKVKNQEIIDTLINSTQANDSSRLLTIIGTPPYAPPEQMCKDDPKTVYANDIFAVGVIAIEGLTGTTNIKDWQSDYSNKIRSKSLVRFINKMTHKDCEKRYINAGHTLDEIENVALCSSSREYSFKERFKNWWERGEF